MNTFGDHAGGAIDLLRWLVPFEGTKEGLDFSHVHKLVALRTAPHDCLPLTSSLELVS
jgi:hypothetical protein